MAIVYFENNWKKRTWQKIKNQGQSLMIPGLYANANKVW